jgi:hypothetical protein
MTAGLDGLAALGFVLPAATPRIQGQGESHGSVAALKKIRSGGSDH